MKNITAVFKDIYDGLSPVTLGFMLGIVSSVILCCLALSLLK